LANRNGCLSLPPFLTTLVLIDMLGDAGYVLEPWMIIPFGNTEEDSPERRFNKCHCSDRNTVERVIGALKERFR